MIDRPGLLLVALLLASQPAAAAEIEGKTYSFYVNATATSKGNLGTQVIDYAGGGISFYASDRGQYFVGDAGSANNLGAGGAQLSNGQAKCHRDRAYPTVKTCYKITLRGNEFAIVVDSQAVEGVTDIKQFKMTTDGETCRVTTYAAQYRQVFMGKVVDTRSNIRMTGQDCTVYEGPIFLQ